MLFQSILRQDATFFCPDEWQRARPAFGMPISRLFSWTASVLLFQAQRGATAAVPFPRG